MSDPTVLDRFTADELMQELRSRGGRAGLTAEAATTDPQLKDVPSPEIADRIRDDQKLVYGSDDRRDLFEVGNPQVRADAASVVSLIRVSDILDNGDGTSRLDTRLFQDDYNLCSSERFARQPVCAFCSGVLVGPELVATAGHCLKKKEADLAGMRFVFGFSMLDAQTARDVISNSDIYQGVEVIGHQLTASGTDWTLVRLDRPATGRPVARLRRQGRVADQQRLHVIGHPCGLPLKVARGARVRDNQAPEFFVANLDTYGGNSGSPVFNSTTHEVEGLLVRGDTDFVMVDGCNVSMVCPDTGCRGEDVTRASEFQALVPE